MWFIGVEVEQETSAPPPKKNPGSAPAFVSNMVALYITKQQEYYTLYMFHYVESVYFC